MVYWPLYVSICVYSSQTTATSTQSVTAQGHDGGSPSLSVQAPAQTFHLQPEEQTAVSTASVCVCVCVCALISVCIFTPQYDPLFPHCFTAFSCPAGKFLEMTTQQCTPCATGSYSLGSGLRFDQWDAIPAGFTSLASFLDPGPNGEDIQACNRWHRHSQTLLFLQVRQVNMVLSTDILDYYIVYDYCSFLLFCWMCFVRAAAPRGRHRVCIWSRTAMSVQCLWFTPSIWRNRAPSPSPTSTPTTTSSLSSM